MFDHCIVCNAKHSVQLCSGCNVATYCSTNCQSKDWITEHHKLCKVLPLLFIDKRGRDDDEEENDDENPPKQRLKVYNEADKQLLYDKALLHEKLLKTGNLEMFFNSATLQDIFIIDTNYDTLFHLRIRENPEILFDWLVKNEYIESDVEFSSNVDSVTEYIQKLQSLFGPKLQNGEIIYINVTNSEFDAKITEFQNLLLVKKLEETPPKSYGKTVKLAVGSLTALVTFLAYAQWIMDPYSWGLIQ